MRKVIFVVMVMGALMVGPVLAQNIQVGGEQQRNTQQTTETFQTTGPSGEKVQKSVTTNVNLPVVALPVKLHNPTGPIVYSGVPCKWMRPAKIEEGKAVVAPEGK